MPEVRKLVTGRAWPPPELPLSPELSICLVPTIPVRAAERRAASLLTSLSPAQCQRKCTMNWLRQSKELAAATCLRRAARPPLNPPPGSSDLCRARQGLMSGGGGCLSPPPRQRVPPHTLSHCCLWAFAEIPGPTQKACSPPGLVLLPLAADSPQARPTWHPD